MPHENKPSEVDFSYSFGSVHCCLFIALTPSFPLRLRDRLTLTLHPMSPLHTPLLCFATFFLSILDSGLPPAPLPFDCSSTFPIDSLVLFHIFKTSYTFWLLLMR